MPTWFSVNYFRFSFGNSESLYRVIQTLQRENQIPINMRIPDLVTLLEQLVLIMCKLEGIIKSL